MMQYKVVAVPAVPVKVKAGEYHRAIEKGVSEETANAALENVAATIQEYGKAGWVLHSIEYVPTRVKRKKSFWELLFSWIPILGSLLFRNLDETREGRDMTVYTITFVREAAV